MNKMKQSKNYKKKIEEQRLKIKELEDKLTIKDQYFKEKNNCVNNNALSMIDLENKILEFKNRETDLESKILEHIK